MADVSNKYPENVAGAYYCDDQCIDCDLCRETAPANFKRNDDGGHSYVFKQPETPRRRPSARRPWKAAQSRRSATTVSNRHVGSGQRPFPSEMDRGPQVASGMARI